LDITSYDLQELKQAWSPK